MYFPSSKKKALISFAVTAKLICAFVFAYADCWFSHEAAHREHDGLVLECRILDEEPLDSNCT